MKKHVNENVSEKSKVGSDEEKKLIDKGVESFEDTLASKISASVMGE